MPKKVTLNELADMLTHVVQHMATKDDVRAIVREEIHNLVPGIVAVEIAPLRAELRDINRRLDALDDNYKNLKGVTKEIDELRARVRNIEKHLRLNKKIAA